MRSVIGSFAAVLAAPLLIGVAAAFVSMPASSAPNAMDAIAKDALPSPEAGKDAFPTPDAAKDAGPKKPDALPPPSDTPKPIPPDPVPLVGNGIYVLTVKWDKGKLAIEKVRREKLAKPSAVERHLGRFAAELYSGPTLVERLRFDFPLIEDDTALGDTYAKGLTVTVEVKIPDSDRPNKLEIWDRATDRRWSFSYPPAAP